MNERRRAKLLRESIDPVEQRWYERFPRRPSINDCLAVLKEHNTRGYLLEIVCWELEEHAKDSPQEVIDLTRECTDSWQRHMLLGAIEIAQIPEAASLFADILEKGVPDERPYAIRGLKSLDTKEARTILYRMGIR